MFHFRFGQVHALEGGILIVVSSKAHMLARLTGVHSGVRGVYLSI